jgi:hypothetical protein
MGNFVARPGIERRSRAGRASALLALGAAALTSATAAAQGNSQSAMAEALFRNGRTLMAAGNYAEACPKFAESQKIDPKLGTLMNLALCHEKAGLSASAWAEYAQAAELARRSAQSEREAVARERVSALEASLTHVVVDADAKSELVVTLDGQPIGAGAYGTPMPVDPGDHVLQADCPGKAPFRFPFHAAPGDRDRTIHVPPPASMEPGAVAPAARPVAPSAAAEPGRGGSGASLRTAGFVVGGVGLLAVGVGAFFGVRAFSDKTDAEKACSAGGACTGPGKDATSAMKTDEVISTIGVIVGAAAIAGGAYLVLTSKSPEAHASSPQARVRFELTTRGVAAGVEW